MNKERPILFRAPMVRAILEGRKAQTRRVVKPQPVGNADVQFRVAAAVTIDGGKQLRCPYGQPGDRLWVRETGWERPIRTPRQMREGADTWPKFAYDADGWTDDDHADMKRWGFRRRPSIHMPRWASRILLEVTAVRVDRLSNISEADSIAEGVESVRNEGVYWRDYSNPDGRDCVSMTALTPVESYKTLWESINGSLSMNPWVWVVEFKRVTP